MKSPKYEELREEAKSSFRLWSSCLKCKKMSINLVWFSYIKAIDKA
ncbi:MAG TPA: hypothetical protein ACFCUD_09555 [Cyclobacteriaceae bacterium]